MLTAALATFLTVTPPAPFSYAPIGVEQVEHGDDLELRAYDSAGKVIGTIALWYEGDTITIAADYADGWVETEISSGEPTTNLSGITLAEAERRASLIEELAISNGPPAAERGGWIECTLGVVITAAACVAAQPLGCVGGSIATACACLPLTIEEFKDLGCI